VIRTTLTFQAAKRIQTLHVSATDTGVQSLSYGLATWKVFARRRNPRRFPVAVPLLGKLGAGSVIVFYGCSEYKADTKWGNVSLLLYGNLPCGRGDDGQTDVSHRANYG
jgi:hypothetical protein